MYSNHVAEYKCPCCDAGLHFDGASQTLSCQYCENTFDLESVKAYNDAQRKENCDTTQWSEDQKENWSAEDAEALHSYECPSCGGGLITDAHTAATFCPFCGNPAILPSRISDTVKPDAVLPFRTTKEDAKKAFLEHCKGKLLLPKFFTKEQQLEKIVGMYVPFWLYDCEGNFDGSYKATRIMKWSDSNYHYTKTDHFLLTRGADASFVGIPMDASSKMDDTFMEAIEPYDYSQLTEFDKAYLTGYLADKYDVESEAGEERVRQRVDQSMNDLLQSSFLGYATVIPTNRNLTVADNRAKYVLLPVWMLNTKYNGNIYTFAMNGQTGKIAGTLPICPKRTAAWFAGIFAGVTVLASLVQLLM